MENVTGRVPLAWSDRQIIQIREGELQTVNSAPDKKVGQGAMWRGRWDDVEEELSKRPSVR